MSTSSTVTLHGTALDITYTGSNYRPATCWEPEEPAEIEIEEVLCNGTDIFDLISEATLNNITDALFQAKAEAAWEYF
jgi:hypothetical protein